MKNPSGNLTVKFDKVIIGSLEMETSFFEDVDMIVTSDPELALASVLSLFNSDEEPIGISFYSNDWPQDTFGTAGTGEILETDGDTSGDDDTSVVVVSIDDKVVTDGDAE